MADLTVTFCKTITPGLSERPVPRGNSARTTALLIGASSVDTDDVALAGEYAILKAGAACWVAVGSAPEAEALASGATVQAIGVIPMAAGEVMSLAMEAGDKVAVIEA